MRDINKPKLRFKEFNDEWQQMKINDLYTVNTGKSKYKKEDVGNYKVLGSVGIVGQSNSYDYNGDFVLIARVGAYAGSLYLYSGKVKITDNTIFIKSDSHVFAYLLLKHKNLNRLVFGSGQPLIKSSELQNLTINVPKTEKEQRQIELFFNKIDDLIELKSNKIVSLERLKRGYLQKLFTDLTEHKPKLRFKGFNNDWSIKKVKNLTIVNPKNTDYKDTFNYVDLNSVENGNLVSYRTEKYKNAPSRAKRIAKVNDIFYQTVRPYQNNNLYFDVKSSEQFVFSTGYAQIRADKVNSKMLFYYFLKYEFNQKVINLCTGTSFPAISSNDLASIKISVPKSTEEQQKIGNIMTLIDKQINLQQKELDRLKTLKKGYLQKMFV